MITDAGKDLIWKKVKNKILRENKGKNKKNMCWINTVKVKVKVAWAAAHGLNVKKDIFKKIRKITVADGMMGPCSAAADRLSEEKKRMRIKSMKKKNGEKK